MVSALLRAMAHSTICFVMVLVAMPAYGNDYSPLVVRAGGDHNTLDITVHDKTRARTIPILVYLPDVTTPAPLILYSHGLGGSRKGNVYLGRHWSARGYIVVFLQHPGSDVAVWKGIDKSRPLKRLKALKAAANFQNFLLRVKDVSVVLDQLAEWNNDGTHELKGHFDLDKVGMSGHSFGALTTQAVSGQEFNEVNAQLTEKRIIAALPMSPSSPVKGSPADAFGNVVIPWMLMTGTNDSIPFRKDKDPKSRLAVFSALPVGAKYELVLFGAAHSAFTENDMKRGLKSKNPNHHRVILALSTAFWDAYLRKDRAAKLWLDGDGPKSVLDAQDTWKTK